MSHNIHENSTEAHEKRKGSGVLENDRKRAFVALVGEALTDSEVTYKYEGDPNKRRGSYAAEITRLRDDGLVGEVCKKTCQFSKQTVRVSRATVGLDGYFPKTKSAGKKREKVVEVLSDTLPSVPGFYWYGCITEAKPRVLEVLQVAGTLWVRTHPSVTKLADFPDGYWGYAPIEEPVYPPKSGE